MMSKLSLLICVLLAVPFLLIAIALLQNDLPWNDPPGFGKRLATYLNNNDVQTRVDTVFPELLPRRYAVKTEELRKVITESIEKLEWEIIQPFNESNTLHAVVSTRLFNFKDDFYITLEQEDGGTQLVNVRSVSRLGKGDLGTNTRHVLDFFSALDAIMIRAGSY